MEHLIDTSALIAAERGRLDLAVRLRSHPSDGFYLSVIIASELLHGCTERRNRSDDCGGPNS